MTHSPVKLSLLIVLVFLNMILPHRSGFVSAEPSVPKADILDSLTGMDLFFETGPDFCTPILDCKAVKPIDSTGFESGTLSLPFAKQPGMDRAYVDFPLSFDTTRSGTFYLDVKYEHSQAVSSIICYFASGNGWYSMSPKIERKSETETRITFSPATARVEGTPAGLQNVKAVRLAFYAGLRIDSSVELLGLYTRANDVLIVQPSSGRSGTTAAEAERIAAQFSGLLQKNGLNPGTVMESDLTSEVLKNHPVVVLPIVSTLTPESIDILCKYMDDGGFVIVCYGAPVKLLQKMGFQQTGYIRCSTRNLNISGIRLTQEFRNRLGGQMPEFLPQASWNFVVGQPIEREGISDPVLRQTENEPKIVGYWTESAMDMTADKTADKSANKTSDNLSDNLSDNASDTQYPAMLWSRHGLWITHVLLNEGAEQKVNFLAGIINQYEPKYLSRLLRQRWQTLLQIGLSPEDDIPLKRTATAEWALNQLEQQGYTNQQVQQMILDGDTTGTGITLAAKLDSLVVEYRDMFCRNQQPKANEKRYIWEHSGLGTYPGDWDATMKELADAGFTGILCNMAWAGRAQYKSNVLPVSSHVEQYGDQIEQAVRAGKKYGVEVHVWKVDYNCSNSTQDFIAQMRTEGRLQVSITGEEQSWLCPSDPKNKDLEVESFKEIVRNYGVDGIHFDYIRFPTSSYCFCDGCRQRFGEYYKAKTGKDLNSINNTSWPGCTRLVPEVRHLWQQWRGEQITEVVRRTHAAVKAIRSDIQVSAAVFSSYPSCAESIGQDWVEWSKNGWLDFVCPMDYTNNPEQFANIVRAQQEVLGDTVPMYPGIGIASSGSLLTPDQCIVQINVARRLNTPGWTIFCLNPRTAASHFPCLKQGVTKPIAQKN